MWNHLEDDRVEVCPGGKAPLKTGGRDGVEEIVIPKQEDNQSGEELGGGEFWWLENISRGWDEMKEISKRIDPFSQVWKEQFKTFWNSLSKNTYKLILLPNKCCFFTH